MSAKKSNRKSIFGWSKNQTRALAGYMGVGTMLLSPMAAFCAETVNLQATAPAAIANAQGVINVGGHAKLINAGDAITASERAALAQLTATGHQSVLLGANGNAIGGMLNLGTDINSTMHNFVIPANVNVLGNFATINSLNVLGNLINSGNLYGYSTNAGITNATIDANNILNNVGGTISTILPQGLGVRSANAQTDLTLNVIGDVVNKGAITSSRDLNIFAGGTIVNDSTISAMNNVSLSSIAGSIINSGNITATNGNINLAGGNGALSIDSTVGVLSATNGSINVRDAAYGGTDATRLMGGDYLSNALNIHGGAGRLDATVGQVTGVLNLNADNAHFNADTANLVIGSAKIAGDPIFTNTGNLVVSSGTYNESVTYIAGGTISSASAVTIRAVDGAGVGQPINMIAGAAFNTAGGNVTVTGPKVNGFNIGSGGNISLAAGSVLDASGSNGSGAGILLAAYSASAGGLPTGQATVNNGLVVNTSGVNGGISGAVTVIANQTSLGNITATGVGGGTVTITAAQPSGSVAFDATTGAYVSGALTAGTNVLAGAISTSSINTAGPVTITGNSLSQAAGNSITAPSVSLNATTGLLPSNVGGSSNRFVVNTPALSVTARTNAYLTNNAATSTVNGTGGQGTGNVFDIMAPGNTLNINGILARNINVSAGTINVNGLVNAAMNSNVGTVNLTATSGSIGVNSTVNATNGTSTLSAATDITGSGTIAGVNVVLNATTGSIGSGTRLLVNAFGINANAGTNVLITDILDTTIAGTATNGNFDFLGAGNATVGTVNGVSGVSGKSVTIDANDLTLNQPVTGTNGNVFITSGKAFDVKQNISALGTGSIATVFAPSITGRPNATVTASEVQLQATSTSIGTSTQSVETSTANLFAQAPTNVFVANAIAGTAAGSATNGDFSVSSPASLTVGTVNGVSGITAGVNALVSGSSVAITQSVNAPAGSATITATGATGSITTASGARLVAPTVQLNASGGDILVDTTASSLSVSNTGGSSAIDNSGAITVLGGTNTGAGSLAVSVDTGDITVGTGTVTANGGIVLLAPQGAIRGPGTLTSTGNAALTTGAGEITVNTDIGSLTATTTGGNVTVTEANGLTLTGANTAATGTFSVTATAGSINTDATGTVAGANVVLNASAGDIGAANAALKLTGPTKVTANAQHVYLTSDNSVELVGSNAATANNGVFSVTADSDITAGATALDSVSSTTLSFVSSNGDLHVGRLTADDMNLSTKATKQIEFTSDVTANNSLTATTGSVRFSNNPSIFATAVDVSSPADLTISGTGTVTGVITNFVATNDLIIQNDAHLTFGGPTNLASGAAGAIRLNGSYTIVPSPFGLNLFVGSGGLIGNPAGILGNFTLTTLNGGAGTISNPNGDVVLTGNLKFQGGDLAILASGNILAGSKVTSINLSNPKGNGGNLTMIAGYDLTGTSSSIPISGAYTVTGPSSSGGSIYLPKVSINTSSTSTKSIVTDGTNSVGPQGGAVMAIAGAGDTNTGAIVLGSINTSANAKVGKAGAVSVYGEGGVITGSINTKGATGGLVELGGGLNTQPGGPVSIVNGTVQPGGILIASILTGATGAGVNVNGSITTTGSVGRGGNIGIQADQQVVVTGGITTSGVAVTPGGSSTSASGGISLMSFGSSVTTGAINTSALPSSSATAAGAAGTLLISGNNMTIGTFTANGADNTGTGAGGNGGSIVTLSNLNNALTNFGSSNAITVNGYVDAHGGKGGTGAAGGSGGSLSFDSGTLAVTSSKNGISINAAGGAAGKSGGTAGNAGSVSIETNAVQQLPTNFDLTNSVANVPIRAGGLFTVGSANPVNGTAGSIAADIVVSKTSNLGGPVNGINTTSGTTQASPQVTLIIDGDTASSFVPGTGARVLATPAAAVTKFQADRGQATSFDVTIDQSELNGTTFSAFKVPAAYTVNVTGSRPVLNLPTTTALNGTLNFTDANSTAYLNLGSGNFVNNGTINATAAGASLVMSGTGTSWTNNGTLAVTNLVLARPTSTPLTITTGATGVTNVDQFLIGNQSTAGMAVNIRANAEAESSNYSLPVTFAAFEVPTILPNNTAALAALGAGLPKLALNFSLSQNNLNTLQPLAAVVQSAPGYALLVSSGTIGATNASAFSPTQTVGTPLNVIGALIGAQSTLSVTNSGSSINLIGSDLAVGTKLTTAVTAGGGIANVVGSSLFAGNSVAVTSTGAVTVAASVITSGALTANAPAFGGPLLTKADIAKAGAVSISGTSGVDIAISEITSNGANTTIVAKGTGANLTFGDSNTITARGSYIMAFAKGAVTGGSGNIIQADGLVGMTNTGGVQIGSGLTQGNGAFSGAFSRPAGTVPAAGSIGDVLITNGGTGAVVRNPAGGGGTINVGTNHQANFNLNGGVIVLDAVGANSSVSFSGPLTITTHSAKPVAFLHASGEGADQEFVVETDEEFAQESVANGIH